VRIEDDVAVTKDGYEVLTAALVKDADGIEKLMNA
jgi:Xaa-Pro aminopeptidase